MGNYLGKEIAEWRLDTINRFWDFSSKEPNKYFTHIHGKEIVSFFKDEISKNSTILDYGAGLGFLSEILLDKGYQVKCLDSSPDSLNILQEKLGHYRNFLGSNNLESIKQLDEKFDTIFVIEVIEHLYDDYLNELLENVRDLLTEKGRVIFTTPNQENLSESLIYCPFSDLVFHRWQHVRSWDANSLRKKLKDSGFNSVEIEETHFIPIPKWKGFNRKSIGHILGYLRDKIEKRKPHLVAIAALN